MTRTPQVQPLAALTALLTAASPLFAVDYFSEDFEGLVLNQVVTFESEIREREAWTDVPPAGWTVDDSGVPSIGDPNSGVVEFEGWSFVDKDWWILTAGGQQRESFLNASGIVAVADPDEWDDFGDPTGTFDPPEFDAKLLTPAINIGGAAAGDLKAFFHSSWLPEDTQKASLTAYYDGSPTGVEIFRWESGAGDEQSPNPFFKAEAPNESLTVDLLNPGGASTVQLEFRVFDATNDWWWAFDNLKVFDGAAPAADGVLRLIIDRDTQDVQIVNNTGESVELRGYSIVSGDGVFDEAGASFQADSDAGWLQATQTGDDSNDLSELHLTFDTFADSSAIQLGDVWRKYYLDETDLSFTYLVEGNDDPIQGLVEFTGNGGESFEFLDLNYNGQIEIGDWETFKAGFGLVLAGLTSQQQYSLGDVDGDGLHTLNDFIEFERIYDAANGAGAFAAALAAPEPGGLLLISLAAVGLAFRRRSAAFGTMLMLIALGTAADRAEAQLTLLSEDFESLPLFDPLEEDAVPGASNVVTRVAPAGWAIDNSGIPVGTRPGTGEEPPVVNVDGVIDWLGWSFADKEFWVAIAGQDRDGFTRGSGTIAVADSDEWDDAENLVGDEDTGNLENFYDTIFTTPTVNIPAGIPAGRVQLAFDSSWRQEFDDPAGQISTVSVKYNDRDEFEALRWESNPESDFFKPDSLSERVVLDLDYDGVSSSVQIDFGHFNADNDWWWAIDNVLLSVPADPSVLRVYEGNGIAELVGGDVINADIKSIDIISENGQLTGSASGLTSAAGESADGPDGGATAGDSSGEQWEVLANGSGRFTEAFLFGDSAFDSNRVANLGFLFDENAAIAADQDLTFTYSLASGDTITGIVQVLPGDGPTVDPLLLGDADGDGDVDGDDLIAVQTNFGSVTPPPGDADFDGDVDGDDLIAVQTNFGSTSATSVPEPGAAGLLLAGIAGLVSRRRRASASRRSVLPAAAIAAIALVGSAANATTNDREYLFGDAPSENAVPGQPVGGASSNGATFDSEGSPGMNQLIDLLPEGNLFIPPNYITVNDRPDGVNGLGIELNPIGIEEQYLATGFGEALNFPERSASSTLAVPAGTIDYNFISDRGFQIWAKPTAINGRANIVMDTNQHGVFIDEDGNYAMRYAEADYSSDIPAQIGQWAHLTVVRPFGPGGGSILYVDGVAGAAANGEYRIEVVVNEDLPDSNLADNDTSPLVIGASTGQSTLAVGSSDFFSGVVDDLEMYVIGLNNSDDYGEFVFENDDRYASAFKPSNPVDLTGDNLITNADAQVFAANWRSEKVLSFINQLEEEDSLRVGDLQTRLQGDFNFDGITDLSDWAMLNNANPGVAALAMGLITGSVPEPAAGLLMLLAGVSAVAGRRV